MSDLPIVIAEIGLNHNGSVDTAIKLMKSIGLIANRYRYPKEKIYVKFQKREPRVSTPEHMWYTSRVSPVSGKQMTYIEYKEEIELSLGDYQEINNYAGSHWFASVWDLPSVEFFVENFPGVPYLKIPSAHLTNFSLIQACVDTKIPLIISTGMSTEQEIRDMLAATPQNYPLVLMACTATYPCPDDQIHLRKMDLLGSLAHQYRRSPKIGFSSHSPSPFPPIYAGLWGADYIEVHVTLDRTMPGSDHAASLELPAVDLLLRELKRQEVILGPDEITVFPDEHEKRKALRGL